MRSFKVICACIFVFSLHSTSIVYANQDGSYDETIVSENSQSLTEREEWLRNPYPDTPQSVTDEDIRITSNKAINDVFKSLKSPKLISSYEICKSKEIIRISKNIKNVRDLAENSQTNQEKNTLLEHANSIDRVKQNAAPSSCLLRLVRRATIDLNIPYNGEQPKHGPHIPIDESFHVSQLHQVAKALNDGSFTDKFYARMSDELKYNHDEWMEQFVVKPKKQAAEILKSQIPSKAERGKVDDGLNFELGRKSNFYNRVIVKILELINSKSVTP